jgi:hypothetical protein
VKVVALIPYFGGISPAARARQENRLDHLEQTIASLDGFDVIVGVCSDTDAFDAGADVVIDTKPEWLPANLCRWAQENVQTDLVYVTEADQILTLDRVLLGVPDDEKYLVPHRLNEVGPDGGTHDLTVGGKEYEAPNGLPEGDGEFYQPPGSIARYGGAFLATRDLFKRVKFKLSKHAPVEHATGGDIGLAGECLKTTVVERFWVEHLSSREHHGIA